MKRCLCGWSGDELLIIRIACGEQREVCPRCKNSEGLLVDSHEHEPGRLWCGRHRRNYVKIPGHSYCWCSECEFEERVRFKYEMEAGR